MDRTKMPAPLDPAALNDPAVHAMYAANIPGMTDAKLAVDLVALLLRTPGPKQLLAARQVATEIQRRVLKS
jgi:hypothetical protein